MIATVAMREIDSLVTAAEQRAAYDESMAAAAERRAYEVSRISAQGAAEAEKVEKATAKLRAETSTKVQEMASTNAANAAAAARRRAATLEATRAKSAAEVAKTSYYSRMPTSPDSVLVASLDANPATAPDQGEGSGTRRERQVHESGLGAMSSGRGVDGEECLEPSDSIVMSPRGIGPRLQDPESVARRADMLLALMRGGAPNVAVLSATTIGDLAGVAARFGIALDAAADSSASGANGPAPAPAMD